MLPRYALRIPGTETLFRRCWTIRGAHNLKDRLQAKYGIGTEFVFVRWVWED